jgi:hypothetical protein
MFNLFEVVLLPTRKTEELKIFQANNRAVA